VHVHARDAGHAAAELLAQLGPTLQSVQAFEIVRPSLETVFLQLTGRRYDDAGEDDADVA